MRAGFRGRRGADRFDALIGDLIDGRSAGGGPEVSPADEPELLELRELVGAMRGLPDAVPRPEFVTSLRERLLVEAAAVLTPTPVPSLDERLTVAPHRSTRDRRIAAAALALALVGGSAGLAVASRDAVPGDLLYPLKRAIENIHTGVSLGDAHKGTTLLTNASYRLDETDELTSGSGPAHAADVQESLDSFSEQADRASDLLLHDYTTTGDEDSVVELRTFTVASLTTLDTLEALVPEGARTALLGAGGVLTKIDEATTQLCPTCDGPTLTEIPDWLTQQALGPDGAVDLSPAEVVPSVPAPVLTPSATPSPRNRGATRGPGTTGLTGGGGTGQPAAPAAPAAPTAPAGSAGGQPPADTPDGGGAGGQQPDQNTDKPPITLPSVRLPTVLPTRLPTLPGVPTGTGGLGGVVSGVGGIVGGLLSPSP